MCLGAIYWARPARIFYAANGTEAAAAGFDDQFIYEEIKRPTEQRNIPSAQILHDESQAVFAAWAAQENKQSY
jgi:tRNA(Arg) A34 adenosine deaminase TadA